MTIGMVGREVGGYRITRILDKGYSAQCMYCGVDVTLQGLSGKGFPRVCGCYGNGKMPVPKKALRAYRRKLAASKERGYFKAKKAATPTEYPGRSRYQGVSWDKGEGMWLAYVYLPGRKQKKVGRFYDEDEAGAAAEVARKQL